jgi:hypothetical protein
MIYILLITNYLQNQLFISTQILLITLNFSKYQRTIIYLCFVLNTHNCGLRIAFGELTSFGCGFRIEFPISKKTFGRKYYTWWRASYFLTRAYRGCKTRTHLFFNAKRRRNTGGIIVIQNIFEVTCKIFQKYTKALLPFGVRLFPDAYS